MIFYTYLVNQESSF